VDQWLAIREASHERGTLEFATLRKYRLAARYLYNSSIMSIKLSRLTEANVYHLIDELRTGPRLVKPGYRTERKPQLGDAMIQEILICLKMSVVEAKRRGQVSRNVTFGIGLGKSDRRQRPIIPTKDEIKAILAHADGMWRVLLMTAIFTGLRASELRGLPWKDVDLDKGALSVTQRAEFRGIIGPPKSEAGTRVVPLPVQLANELKEYKLSLPLPHDLVFPNPANRGMRKYPLRPLRYSHLYVQFDRIQREAGVVDKDGKAKFSPHELRHFYASWLLADMNLSIKRVQALMGHSKATMTLERYGHLMPSYEDDQTKFGAAAARLLKDAS
jgi:integrase